MLARIITVIICTNMYYTIYIYLHNVFKQFKQNGIKSSEFAYLIKQQKEKNFTCQTNIITDHILL